MQKIILSNARTFIGSHSREDFLPSISKFADGEIALDFTSLDFSAQSFLVVQSLFGSSDAILELLFAIDVISRNSSRPINILLPYLSYSRQDREISKTSPISAKVVADLLSRNVTSVSIVDLHSPQLQGFFQKPCFNISLQDIFLADIQKSFDLSTSVIVSADIGGAKNAHQIATKLGIESAVVEKVRPKAGVSKALSIIGDIVGKTCILIDDIIDTAGTLCNAGDILHKNGAKSVIAYASHGLFSGDAIKKIEVSGISKVFVSNTVPVPDVSEKIIQFDVSKFVLEKTCEQLTHFRA